MLIYIVFIFAGLNSLIFKSYTMASEKEVSTEHIYDNEQVNGTNNGKPLYETTMVTETDGTVRRSHLKTVNWEGTLVSEQTLIYQNDFPKEYTRTNYETKTSVKAVVKGDEVFLDKQSDGKTDTSKDKVSDNWVIGPSLNRFVQTHVSDLIEGKEIRIRLMVPMRADTFGFYLARVDGDEQEIKMGKWIKVRMKPTSLLLRPLIKAMYFFIDKTSGKIKMYIGPTDFHKPGSTSDVFARVLYD